MTRPLFAQYVRKTERSRNRNDQPHRERLVTATLPYVAIEDVEAFHEIAEQVRLQMIAALRLEAAPINVWRIGQVGGVVSIDMAVHTSEGLEHIATDAHKFYVRTRVSVEQPPYVLAEENT